MKKLKLHKETLRTLRPDQLEVVVSGAKILQFDTDSGATATCTCPTHTCLDTMQQCSGPK